MSPQIMSRRPAAQAPKVGVLATIASVLAAFFGVQSSRVRQRDFTRGSPALFLTTALVLTAGLVLLLYAIVQLVIATAVG
ncbi:DUF2970 domain-containing protein [Panacagrimonas sp.]|uniref:DUF2970 domain-containing protein n=1 Tax=Panacagrimonas sp. TaxID=2480088 RepID=UPI003B52A861